MISANKRPSVATPLSATFLVFGILGMSAPALAADGDSPWAGFYIGANAGVTWSDSGADASVRTTGTPPTVNPVPPSDITAINASTHFDSKHHTGFTGGLEAGYNYVMDGGLLLGLETDINIYDITGGKTVTRTTPITTPSVPPVSYTYTVNQSVDTDFIWTLRPRIGYAAEKYMIFASGGLALTTTKFRASVVDSRTGANTVTIDRGNKTKTGWTIGAGGAYAITPQISIKGEYLYQNFGDTDFHGVSTNGYLAYDAVAHLKSHIFRAGVDYRF